VHASAPSAASSRRRPLLVVYGCERLDQPVARASSGRRAGAAQEVIRCRFRVPARGRAARPPWRRSLRASPAASSRPRADRDHRSATGVDRFDDFGVVDALQVDRGDAEVAVSELALDDDQRHAFACPAGRPRAAGERPLTMHNSGPTGSVTRAVSHGSSSCHPSRPSRPRGVVLLQCRTSSEPRGRSRSAS
jgi:hypothetical protein